MSSLVTAPQPRRVTVARSPCRRWLPLLLLVTACSRGVAPVPGNDAISGETVVDAAAESSDLGPASSASDVADAGGLADSSSDATEQAGDATAVASVDAQLLEVESDAADSGPAVATLTVHIVSPQPITGTAKVRLVPGSGPLGPVEAPGSFSCYTGPLTLPMDVPCEPPDGDWRLRVTVMGSGSYAGGGLACAGADPLILHFGADYPLASDVTVVLQGAGNGGGTSCATPGGDTGAKLQPFLKPIETIAPPNSANGAPNYGSGLVFAERFWVAATKDGFVHFDVPAVPPAVPPPLANWAVEGNGPCTRMVRAGTTLLCSNRTSQLQLLTLAMGTQAVVATDKLQLGPTVRGEGMLALASRIFVAGHQAGLVARDAIPPFSEQPFAIAELTDSWDVALQDPDRLAVADGENGLRIVEIQEQKILATLPLPGRCAFVAANGNNVVVGALGGGLHLIDAGDFLNPKLRATIDTTGDVFGVAVENGRMFAASGHWLLAWDLPASGQPITRAVSRSQGFAVDVDRLGPSEVLSTELSLIRHLTLDTKASPGGLLLAPPQLTVGNLQVGQMIHAVVQIRNIGSNSLHLQPIKFSETPSASPVTVGGPSQLDPGQVATVTVNVPKKVAGIAHHELTWTSDDPGAPVATTSIDEGAWLQFGDTLPPLLLTNAQNQSVDVNATLAGKPGVVIVAAHSDPLGFLTLASAGTALKPLVSANQINVVAINATDLPTSPEVAALALPFATMFSSAIAAASVAKLAQSQQFGALPAVYVLAADGKIALAGAGWDASTVLLVLQSLIN